MAQASPFVVEQVQVDLLRPDPANPRRISEHQDEALTRSLDRFGFVQPVVARRDDFTVIAGHQRLVAARRLGLTTVPVVWLDLGTEEARLLGLALNRISGTWDQELLARLLADLHGSPSVDLTLAGFDDQETATLLRTLDARERRERPETFDFDAAMAGATRECRTKPGDLWRLGTHRLLCGDATSAADVDRVLAGERPTLTFTDPPYNVDLGNHGGRGRRAARRAMANDRMEPEAWAAFTRTWAGNILRVTDGALYVCMSSKEWPTVATILAEMGGHWSDTLIWTKDRFVLGRADYQRSYEPIWYGWPAGATRVWHGGRDASDVWPIERPSDAPLHPVMKPLALMERAIRNSSDEGDLILDPFAGSGSTLIAAERTGRRCAAIELDPVCVDVAVMRWERFTGDTAERVGG